MYGFSLKKSAWKLELLKWVTFKFYPSLNPAGILIVCGDSHIIFVLPALSYTQGSLRLQLPAEGRRLVQIRELAALAGAEQGAGGGAAPMLLGQFSGAGFYFLFFISSKLVTSISTESSL